MAATEALVALKVLQNPSEQHEDDPKEMETECSRCAHARTVPGNAHIKCVKPDANMSGVRHGIERGWFMYPFLFDPVWKARKCRNFEATDAVSDAISGAVSRAE